MSLITNSGDDAILSACERYRYRLTRTFAPAKTPYVEKENLVAWLMFNPSEADKSKNDPTIRKVIGFSKKWGFTFADVYNKFAGRTPHPSKLWKMDDPVGPDNYEYLKLIPYNVTLVAAWGGIRVPREFEEWCKTVKKMLSCRNVYCLGFTNGGEPRHPLMLPYSTPLQKWTV